MNPPSDLKFFVEYVLVDWSNPYDIEYAKTYLDLWKKFLSRRLQLQLPGYKIAPHPFNEQWVERSAQDIFAEGKYGTMGLKVAYRRIEESELISQPSSQDDPEQK